MYMDAGIFGGDILPDGLISKIFLARVVIPASEFQRLGMGRYEQSSRLPACFRWCFDNLGVGGTRWTVTLRDEAPALVYFEHKQNALAFLARWSGRAVSPSTAAVAA